MNGGGAGWGFGLAASASTRSSVFGGAALTFGPSAFGSTGGASALRGSTTGAALASALGASAAAGAGASIFASALGASAALMSVGSSGSRVSGMRSFFFKSSPKALAFRTARRMGRAASFLARSSSVTFSAMARRPAAWISAFRAVGLEAGAGSGGSTRGPPSDALGSTGRSGSMTGLVLMGGVAPPVPTFSTLFGSAIGWVLSNDRVSFVSCMIGLGNSDVKRAIQALPTVVVSVT